MIIDYFHVICIAFAPIKTDTPLVVDTDAVLARAVALKGFQPVPANSGKVLQAGRRIQPIEPGLGLSRETGEFLDVLAYS